MMIKRFAEFEAALQTASPQCDTIEALSAELQKFKQLTLGMVTAINAQITALSNSIDHIEMRHRRKYLLFAGVPEASGENVAETISAICQDRLQLAEASSSSFSVCHRLGAATAGRTRVILVRCNNPAVKDAIWRKKTALKGSSVVVSEYLTRERQAVFLEARKHYGMRSVWSLEGTIFVKVSAGKTRRVVTAEQLRKLVSECPPPAPQEAATTSGTAAAATGLDDDKASKNASVTMTRSTRRAKTNLK
ncbi:uncharacterized protein LOC134750396 [Cydia strobilella]|uniref:uncharacterized protein LOC134750396 n=1 Tax=Cydia strobilella TaxID=1100964 RepID=UPI00300501DB